MEHASDVLQEGHLGPPPFDVFINRLPFCLQSSQAPMFADDIKKFYCFNTLQDAKRLHSNQSEVSISV